MVSLWNFSVTFGDSHFIYYDYDLQIPFQFCYALSWYAPRCCIKWTECIEGRYVPGPYLLGKRCSPLLGIISSQEHLFVSLLQGVALTAPVQDQVPLPMVPSRNVRNSNSVALPNPFPPLPDNKCFQVHCCIYFISNTTVFHPWGVCITHFIILFHCFKNPCLSIVHGVNSY